MKKIFLFSIFHLIFLTSFGQVTTRIEYPSNGRDYVIKTSRNHKLMVLSTLKDDNNLDVKTDFYDENLKFINTSTVFLEKSELIGSNVSKNGDNFFIYSNSKDYLAILKILSDSNKTEISEYHYKVPKNIFIPIIYENKLFYTTQEDNKYEFYIFDLQTQNNIHVVNPTLVQNRTNLIIYSIETEVYGCKIYYGNINDLKKLSAVSYDFNGNEIEKYTVNLNTEYVIENFNIKKKGDKEILYGTYMIDSRASGSNGIFIGEIEHEKLNYLHFINYLDIPSYVSEFSEKEQEAIKRKKENASKKEKEIYTDLYGRSVDLFTTKQGNIIKFEKNSVVVSKYGERTFYPTQTFAVMFDNNGEEIWDNVIRIQDENVGLSILKNDYEDMAIQNQSIFQFTKGLVNNDSTFTMAWIKYNYIKYKIFDLKTGELLKDKNMFRINPEEDKSPSLIKRALSNTPKLNGWYDYFFTIRSEEKNNDGDKILYFEKIELK